MRVVGYGCFTVGIGICSLASDLNLNLVFAKRYGFHLVLNLIQVAAPILAFSAEQHPWPGYLVASITGVVCLLTMYVIESTRT